MGTNLTAERGFDGSFERVLRILDVQEGRHSKILMRSMTGEFMQLITK